MNYVFDINPCPNVKSEFDFNKTLSFLFVLVGCYMKVIVIGQLKHLCLFHTMASFYVIYWYVCSEWRSIRTVEINQYDIKMASHYDIAMGNDVAKDIHCDITMNNDIAMCTYHGITMHNYISMNIFILYSLLNA